MLTCTGRWYVFILAVLTGSLCGACGSSEELREANSDVEDRRDATARDFPEISLDLLPAQSSVKTVQLYQSGSESSPPFLFGISSAQGSNGGTEGRLTLEFDLLDSFGRPLSVYFYHTNRFWQEDYLSPVQYLSSFNNDDLLEYEVSNTSEVTYTHYTYQFPNPQIQFLIGGNYILRVTERGDEEAVLFERPFLVSESSADMQFGVQNVMVPGSGVPFIQPIAQFEPPPGLTVDLYDFSVCFVRSVRFDLARCNQAPSLIQMPTLQYYLDPRVSFEPQEEIRRLDLQNLQAGGSIQSIDYEARPYAVTLEPDYALLGSNLTGEPLNGQTVIAGSRTLQADPDHSAEYVDVFFRFVPPDEERVIGPVILTGSFNAWQIDPDLRLTWNAETSAYEGSFLLKQGLYEYQYYQPDRRAERRGRRNVFNSESLFSALLYYRDLTMNTDRLISLRTAFAR